MAQSSVKSKKLPPQKLESWDKKFIWHPFTQHSIWDKEPAVIIESGKGGFLRDIRGRRLVDGNSSLWVNLHGHNHPVLNQALKNQLSKIAHSTFLGMSHPTAITLARELARVSPRGLSRTFYSDNGATSVEIALKMAFQYWVEKSGGKRGLRDEFLGLRGSYHGDTIGSVSLGGISTFHSKFHPLLFKTHFAMAPYCYRCPFNKKKAGHRCRNGEKVGLQPRPGDVRQETGCHWQCLGDVEKILKRRSKKIAAGIMEPVVQGAGGIIVLPPGYMAGFQRLCRQYDVLLIADEVATGFGRTGTLFACEQENIRPDFMCLAKALTAGYTPLAATLTTEKVFNAFYGPVSAGRTFFHGHSYTAHPLGTAVALASLKLIENTKQLEKSRYMAQIMKDELKGLEGLPQVGSIRQAGLMAGVELVADKKSRKPFPAARRMGAHVCRALLKKGIWLRPLGDVLVLLPAPVLSEGHLRHLVRSIRDVILHETKT